ncbi:65-kDa microtubule-associated protein 3 [Hibiscus syriacus]|uniref:65-kDa microtubule-associated protein 3 n=1 Tax=Hibiscus syriacus TaxID=106335 RepID=A0A6A3C294_HIBSY|nr:65-kDa microtubule-associated protein 3 [Hibiscus syriacus]
MRHTIADNEAELSAICSAMGKRPVHVRQSDLKIGNSKENLGKILPQVEEMKKRKIERRNHFIDVLDQIQMIRNELSGSTESISSEILVDETDLSLLKLEELHSQLHELQKEKSNRLKQVKDLLNMLNSLCSVMGATINRLREVKIQRMERLQDLATTMMELWHLMDTPIEEDQKFQNVTQVSRLEDLKSSEMKELVLKKISKLKDFCRKTHLVPDTELEDATEAIESGVVDAATNLEQIEFCIAKVKEEAFSRKEILEKVDKWLAAYVEERWLEEYNRKKLQGRIIVEPGLLHRSKLSLSKPQSAKKYSKQSSFKRSALGGSMLKLDSVDFPRTPQVRSSKKTELMFRDDRLNHWQDDAIPAFPAFNRCLETAGTPFRKHSSDAANANEVDPPLVRKPFSPIYPSSKANMTNKLEDNGEGKTLQKTVPTNDLSNTLTCLKINSSAYEKNRTPRAMQPMATTRCRQTKHKLQQHKLRRTMIGIQSKEIMKRSKSRLK